MKINTLLKDSLSNEITQDMNIPDSVSLRLFMSSIRHATLLMPSSRSLKNTVYSKEPRMRSKKTRKYNLNYNEVLGDF